MAALTGIQSYFWWFFPIIVMGICESCFNHSDLWTDSGVRRIWLKKLCCWITVLCRECLGLSVIFFILWSILLCTLNSKTVLKTEPALFISSLSVLKSLGLMLLPQQMTANKQGCPKSVLKGRCPVGFGCFPPSTHPDTSDCVSLTDMCGPWWQDDDGH